MEQELPKRPKQHISETASFKIFNNSIPDNWIVRELTEKDYGIDCYVEIVNDNNQVTGEMISIQLKSMLNGIPWTQKDYYTYSSVKVSTSNYWNNFLTPVFICLIDVKYKEVFFCGVKSFIRNNYEKFAKKEKLSYVIEKKNQLTIRNIKAFTKEYLIEKSINEFDRNLTFIVSNYDYLIQFIEENFGRDMHLGVDDYRILPLENYYRCLKFLSDYFSIKWNLSPLIYYYKKGQEINQGDYDLYEFQISEIVDEFEKVLKIIIEQAKEKITDLESDYWQRHNVHLYNFLTNYGKTEGRISIRLKYTS